MYRLYWARNCCWSNAKYSYLIHNTFILPLTIKQYYAGHSFPPHSSCYSSGKIACYLSGYINSSLTLALTHYISKIINWFFLFILFLFLDKTSALFFCLQMQIGYNLKTIQIRLRLNPSIKTNFDDSAIEMYKNGKYIKDKKVNRLIRGT